MIKGILRRNKNEQPPTKSNAQDLLNEDADEAKEFWTSSSDFWSSVWTNLSENDDFATRAFFESTTLQSWLNGNGFESFEEPLRTSLNVTSIDHLGNIDDADINNFIQNNNTIDAKTKSLFKEEFSKLVSKYHNFVNKTVKCIG